MRDPQPAYLLLELPSMRVVAEARRDVLATRLAPGSLMKVFTLAAALESGVADAGTRIMCRRTVNLDGKPVTCVHPDLHRTLGPEEALAHSCNVYFATLAKRVSRDSLDALLARAGLSPSSPTASMTRVALGLEGTRATPREWLEAFLRMSGSIEPAVALEPATRAVIRRGLELAAREGTASALAEAGYSGMAKTGTAPMPGGGYLGLVAAVVNTELPTHAIIVIAPGTSGANAAVLAAELLTKHNVPHRARRPAALRGPGPLHRSAPALGVVRAFRPADAGTAEGVHYIRLHPAQPTAKSDPGSPTRIAQYVRSPGSVVRSPAPSASARSAPARPRRSSQNVGGLGPGSPVSLGHARRDGRYDVSTIALEDLVARAVAGEGGDALPRAALEALAITVRTFAVRNRGRHAAEGFDLCDLTHCMALRPATARTRAAAVATSGQVLVADGRTAEVYFSASCGGHTERPSAVWAGAEGPTHLVAKADEVCAHESPWVTEVGEPQLRRVLQAAGLRGTLVEILQVESRTTSGRAAVLTVRGMTPGRLDANVFRMTAGRLLGWNVVKSTRFDIARTGTGYRFTGRGLGHGVGLCVRGAGTRAATGSPALEILAWYFPGTNVAPLASGEADVHLVLPESERSQGASVRAMIADTLRSLSATLDVPVPGRVDVVFHPTVGAYTRATGLPWWTSGRTRGTRIDLLPLSVLQRRASVETTVRHELVHVLTDAVLADRPLWVREGLAQTMAGEGADAEPSPRPARPCPSDADLRNPASADAWRAAYDAAAACVTRALGAGVAWRDLR